MNGRRRALFASLVLGAAISMAVLSANTEAAATPARPSAPLHHVVMLDVSGSMRDRGYAKASPGGAHWDLPMQGILHKLLQAGDGCFLATDTVTLAPFSSQRIDDDYHRTPVGPITLSEGPRVQQAIDAMIVDGDTDLTYALENGLSMAGQDGVLWIITDNENNFAGNTTDEQFYTKLRDDSRIASVYLFPLSRDSGDALVAYLILPKRVDWADDLAAEASARLGSSAILFRPILSDQATPDLSIGREITLENAPAGAAVETSPGQITLDYAEGDTLQGELQFKIHSNLRRWRIVGARIDDASALLQVPEGYTTNGETAKAGVNITHRQLTVAPQQDSAETYLLNLSELTVNNEPIMLSRPAAEGLLSALTDSLPPLEGALHLRVQVNLSPSQEQIQPVIDESTRQRLARVPLLPQITTFMITHASMGATPPLTMQLKQQIVVNVSASSHWLVVDGLVAGLVIALTAAGAGLAWGSRAYTLHGNLPSQQLRIPRMFGSTAVKDVAGNTIGTIRAKLGGLTFVPEGSTHGTLPLPLRYEAGTWVCTRDDESTLFKLVEEAHSSSSDSHEEVLL